MSMSIASASALPSTKNELSLTGVAVTFSATRPTTKIKLTIKLDGKERAVEIEKGGLVQWAGELRGMPGAKVGIQMQCPRRRRWMGWKEFGSVEASLTEHPSAVVDVEQRISVMMTVAPSHGGDARLAGSNSDLDLPVLPNAEAPDDVHGTLDILARVHDANEKVTNKIVIADKLGKIWSVLKIIDAIGESLKDIHPAVGMAVATVCSLIKLCEMQKGCRDEASDLVERLMSFLSVEAYIEALKKRTETRRAVGVMLQLIYDASSYICEKTSTGVRGMIGDLIGSEYREKIDSLQKEFERAKESFDRSVQLEIFVAVDGIELTTEFLFIHEKLLECDRAHFKSDSGCLDGTRGDLRHRLAKWIDDTDPDQRNIFWLHGNAGSGKSTVANTVAKMVEDRAGGYLLSCFFCKRDDPDLSNPRRLLSTLAYRFAQQHESYRAAIMKLLRDATRGAGIATTADIKTQFERLFREPLELTVDPLRPHVVVVDALEECGSSEEQTMLAQYILALSKAVPWVKVFVTSRDDPGIHQIFSQAADCISCNINNEKGTDDDIRVYIESQAKELDDPLTDADVAQLVKRAEGLFIWCRTLFGYLRTGIGATSFLEQLLSGEKQDQSPHPWSQLYMLYDKVLDSALGSQTPDAVSFMQSILLIVHVSARNRPLSVNAIMSFLHGRGLYTQFRAKDAENVVKRLHSVLYVVNAVRAHHTSFYDFLQWKANPSSESGWKALGEIHALMAEKCIAILKTDLKFNICKIDTPVLTKDIPDLAMRISTHIPETLQYSSRFWFTHFLPSTLSAAEAERDVLELLQSVKLLFWLECSGLQGDLKQIRFTFRSCMQKFFQPCPAVVAAAEDACRFVSYFVDAMDSIPHIYLSALLWLPEDSLTYKNLGLSQKANWIRSEPQNWDALVWTFGEIRVRSVVFSPDGRFVACGGKHGDVYVPDSETGALDGEPFRGHRNEVLSLAYSPDGHFIVSGSRDNTVRIWNTESGETILGPLEGHSSTISCIAYSPDGHFIAFGSYDCTIRIRNARSGELEGKPLLHPGSVTWVAYSPNGRFIASACDDRCVHVWDTSSHQEATVPFRGHESRIWSIAYSPDGRSIVSGSRDKTIRVWDAQTGQAIGEPIKRHTKDVKSVVYSPNGRFILSGSDDQTMRLWDGTSLAPVGGPLQTHSGRVWSVSYSPDGSLIASASDGGVRVWNASTAFVAGSQPQGPTVQAPIQFLYAVAYSPDGRFMASCIEHSDQIHIWNAHTGAAVDMPVLRHEGLGKEGRIRAIAYSRDGRFIASGSDDRGNNTLCILDVELGATISGPLRGHSECIWSVAYSPVGGCIASASQDGTLRLWDADTAVAIGEPLQVGSPASSVAFSPDGQYIACGTAAGCIWIWDVHTRTSVRDPIHAHSDRIHSVIFSPNGRYIASGSHDHRVGVWDAQTGEAFGDSPRQHQDHVMSIAYSPDGRYIASSSYGEVIIWDVQSGLACGEPLRSSDWVWSVAYSPDGRFLAYGASDGKIYVHHVPNDRDDTEARWIQACSRMDLEDGWIKDGKTLLLWVPAPYRKDIQSCVHFIVPNPTPNITAYSVDYKTILRYSGRNWVHILSGLTE